MVLGYIRNHPHGPSHRPLFKALARELVVWSRFKHPNVLPLSGFYYDDVNFTYACAVTEFQENGNILDYLIRVGPDVEILFKVVQYSPALTAAFR